MHLGRFRSRRLSGLVNRDDPELDFTLFLQVLDLEGQRLISGWGIETSGVLPFRSALQLLLDDVVCDARAPVTLGRGPDEVDGCDVIIGDLGCAGLTGLVWRGVRVNEGEKG